MILAMDRAGFWYFVVLFGTRVRLNILRIPSLVPKKRVRLSVTDSGTSPASLLLATAGTAMTSTEAIEEDP